MSEWNENLARNVVEVFHAAALRPALWPNALQDLACLTGAEGCMLSGGPTSSIEPTCSSSLTELIACSVDGGWVGDDARIKQSLASFQRGQDIVTQSLIFSLRERSDHPFAGDFINRFDHGSYAEIKLAGEGPSCILLKLQRLAGSGPFSEPVIEHLRRLRPQLQDAGELALRVAEVHHDGLMVAFALFDCGAIILDRKGRILRVNAKAEALMADALTIRNGMLRANFSKSDVSLQKLIYSSTRGIGPAAEHFGAIAIVRREGAPFLVHSGHLPTSRADPFRQARAALMIVDPDAYRAPQVPDLRQMFGLTSSEAAIAGALASGHDVDEIAGTRQVSPGTLRAQIRSIFLKTGMRRQSELVSLILRYSRLPRQGLW